MASIDDSNLIFRQIGDAVWEGGVDEREVQGGDKSTCIEDESAFFIQAKIGEARNNLDKALIFFDYSEPIGLGYPGGLDRYKLSQKMPGHDTRDNILSPITSNEAINNVYNLADYRKGLGRKK